MIAFLSMQNDNKEKKEGARISRHKRADLAKEFQEFKQKIQEFQDKNEQIISRIRQAYTFKKKAVEGRPTQLRSIPHQSRVIYYQQGDEGESVASSCDYSKNIVLDGNLVPYPGYPQQVDIPPNEQYPTGEFVGSVNRRNWPEHYLRSPHLSSRVQPDKPFEASYKYGELDPLHNSREVPFNKVRKQASNFNKADEKQWGDKVNSLLEKNRELSEVIVARDEELQRMRGVEIRLKGYTHTVKRLFADQFENYHEEVVLQRFFDLEKYFKKLDNRLRKLSLRLRDTLEERRAHINIQRSKSRRRSASRRDFKHSEGSSADMRDSWVSGPNRDTKTAHLRRKADSQQRVSTENRQKQFAQIAAGYEVMVKAKADEIDRLEQQCRQEVHLKEQYAGDLAKTRILLAEKEKVIEELRNLEKDLAGRTSPQVKEMGQQLARDSLEIKRLEQKQKQLNSMIQKLEKAKKAALEEQKGSFNKSLSKKNQTVAELEERLKQWESVHQREIEQLRARIVFAEKKNIEKECEVVLLSNKIKKLENEIALRDNKLEELEKIVAKDSEPELLERSMSIDGSLISGLEVRNLQEAVRRLQDEIDLKAAALEELQKDRYECRIEANFEREQKERIQKDVLNLQMRIQEFEKEKADKDISLEKENAHQMAQLRAQLEESQKERIQLREEREEMIGKNNELLLGLKRLKEENLSLNRQLIKVNSQLSFNEGEFRVLEAKLNRAKEEINQVRFRSTEQQTQTQQKEKEMKARIQELSQLAEQYVQTISELEANRPFEEKEEENLLNSIHTSELSFNLAAGQRAHQDEVERLKEHIKELEGNLQMKETAEQQVQYEYKQNLQRIRVEISEKNNEIKRLTGQQDSLRRQIKAMQDQQRDDISFENYKISLYEEKIVQLEAELNSCRQSEHKMNELLHQLTENMKEKSQQRAKLIADLQAKEKALDELKEVLEIKELKEINKEESKEFTYRDFSLRISGEHSEEPSDMAQVSYFSNISDIFKRDDVLQSKMKKGKTTREQFIKLFTKTSAYIKSLKSSLDLKDRRIKNLERQLHSLKAEEKRSWGGSKQAKLVESRPFKTEHDREDSIEEYKDYDSVQIDTRRSRSYEIIKELQHEKDLAIEENKMLANQIEMLQDELLRAEQQENSLVKIKDLYKDQIKKIMDKNEVHTKEFEMQIKMLRQELDESQAYHNWEALKQLFVKLVLCIGPMEDPANKHRREEKRKEIEEFVKVVSSILRLEAPVRDKLITSIRK